LKILKYSFFATITTILYLFIALILVYILSNFTTDVRIIDLCSKSTLCFGLLLFFIFIVKSEKNKLNLETVVLCILISAFLETFEILSNRFLLHKLLNISKNYFYEPKPINDEIILFLIYIVMAPLIEEILFRGIILKKMILKTGLIYYSILFSSLLFSLLHVSLLNTVDSIPSMIHNFIFGIVSGLVLTKTNNIIYCIIMHSAVNLIWFLLRYTN
jgi:uncharacterized protein